MSPSVYSAKVGCAVVCAVVDEARGNPFEVELPNELCVSGVVLADQVRTVDVARGVRLVGRAPDDVTARVRQRLLALIE